MCFVGSGKISLAKIGAAYIMRLSSRPPHRLSLPAFTAERLSFADTKAATFHQNTAFYVHARVFTIHRECNTA